MLRHGLNVQVGLCIYISVYTRQGGIIGHALGVLGRPRFSITATNETCSNNDMTCL